MTTVPVPSTILMFTAAGVSRRTRRIASVSAASLSSASTVSVQLAYRPPWTCALKRFLSGVIVVSATV